MIFTHIVYLALSVIIMVAVARSLARSGHVFLVEVFGNETTASAVNTMLVVSFCTTKMGYAALAIRWGGRPETVLAAFEFLTQKIGMVLFVLGIMHAINIAVLCHIRETRATGQFLSRLARLLNF